MTKGFVLTMDAVIATFLGVIITAVIISLLAAGSVNYFDKQQLSSIGYDLLAVLDLSGKLDSYIGGSGVEADLGTQLQLLPENYCGNITVEIYKFQNDEFELVEDYTNTSSGCIQSGDISRVKRIFANISEQRYGIASIKLWLK